MIKWMGVGAFGIALVVGPGASAQTLQAVSGAVLVDTGEGFRAVSPSFALSPGMRVMVSPNGSASIAHDNGCTQSVTPGRVVTVATAVQCTAQESTGGTSRTAEYVPTQGTTPPPGGPPPAVIPPVGPMPFIIGAGVVATGAGLAVGLSNKDNAVSGQ